MTSGVTADLAQQILDTPVAGRVRVVGLAGGVGVGKSTWADALVGEIRRRGSTAVVVSSDSFLHPNAVLDQLGLTLEKGSPASFDVDALVRFLTATRAGALPLEVPVHSHLTYDIDGRRTVPAAEVVVLDGVNVLQPPIRALLDLAVYLDAEIADNRRWFLERFEQLRDAARDDARSFYAQFVALSDEQCAAVANWTWDEMNLPNLLTHIQPTRRLADVVIHAAPDHSLNVVSRSDPVPGRDIGS